ncbi:MAG: hypothetical protein LBD30_04700 [Verrucomicrobiales bacterium]|jgi:uncharacterized protein HemX|nr:hypothetical protein [Verrucomicrobiales bacterium]
MFGFSKDAVPGKRKKKRANMEFDFIVGAAARPAVVKKTPPLTATPSSESAPDPEPVFNPADREPAGAPKPSTEEPSTMSSPFSEPAPIRASESIRRQKQEQGAVNRMLNGVVIAIICFILLVSAAAGFGGYVMWQEIQGNSVTISRLQTDTAGKLAALHRDFTAEHQKLAEQLALANRQIADLNQQLAAAQKTIDTLRRANAQLSQLQTQLQRRVDNQDAAIERVRARQLR